MKVRRYLPRIKSQGRERVQRQLRWPGPAVTAAAINGAAPPISNVEHPTSNTESERQPMAIQTEQRKEYAYLVRELDAFCARKYPSDVDRRYREALEKRLWQLLPDLDIPQLVRMIEATCAVDFPSAVDRNFHDQVMERLGRAHHLKDVRRVEIPGRWVNDRKGRAMPALAAPASGIPKAEGAKQK
jgi:hypothetical protein